jgi:hypothetical protein
MHRWPTWSLGSAKEDEMADDEKRHAIMIIDLPDTTLDEVKGVISALRSCAAHSDDAAWPDEFAVLVDEMADEFSARVKQIVAERRYRISA